MSAYSIIIFISETIIHNQPSNTHRVVFFFLQNIILLPLVVLTLSLARRTFHANH